MAVAANIVGFVAVVLAVTFSMMIVHEVSGRGVKIDVFRLRLDFFRHVSRYRRLTREETGRVGSLFYLCVGSYAVALVSVIVYLLAR